MSHHRPFLVLWVLAVAASVAAFVLHLSMRSKAMHMGYELGRARAEQARLREVRRVLELEVASYHTPQRVETVARTLLRMEPPTPDRMISMGPVGVGAKQADAPLPEARARAAGQVRAQSGKAGAASGANGANGAATGPLVVPAAPTATELLAPRITPPKTATSGEPGGAP